MWCALEAADARQGGVARAMFLSDCEPKHLDSVTATEAREVNAAVERWVESH